MQRMLTGVAAVALALGVWACRKKEGPVNPENEAQVASARNANTRASLAESAQPAATAAAAQAGSASSSAASESASAAGGATHGSTEAQVDSARDYYRLFYTQWRLRKRDRTELRLAFRTREEAIVSATYREAGELVSAIQRCAVSPQSHREFILTCAAPEYVGTYKKQHRYSPDKLLLLYFGQDDLRVFEIPGDPAGGSIPVEVLGAYPPDSPPLAAAPER